MGKIDRLKIVENTLKEYNFSFSKNTTYGCGGCARVAYYPKSIRQSAAVYDYLISEKINFVVLGNGSNILASDKFFDGSVVCTKSLTGVYRSGRDTIFCRAGTKVTSLLKYCADNGFGGLEYLAGIPATLGGLTFMNGGAGGKFICDNIVDVKICDGKIRVLPNKSCNFGHKYSIMRDINCLIVGVNLKIYPDKGEKVKQDIKLYLEKRSSQPKGKSCGCVFKNPHGYGAGALIENAGLKGLSIGCAKVSEQHANFILSSGDCSADIYLLINEVKRRVFEKEGILLEEEVIYIGDF